MHLVSPSDRTDGTAGLPRRVVYPAAAVVLAAGAPVGLMLVRWLACSEATLTCLRSDLLREWPSYLYVTVSTSVVFLFLGRWLGGHADRLADLSETDALTGLANGRALQRRLAGELERSSRYRQPLALLLLDVDGLKAINDAHGHAAGDRALRTVSMAIRSHMRTTDLGARWGGDEFAVVLPNTSRDAALGLAERLRIGIARTGADLPLTTSIGVSAFEPEEGAAAPGPAHFMAAADAALYDAKRTGRNKVVGGVVTRPPTAR